jgi:hypothetical protein
MTIFPNQESDAGLAQNQLEAKQAVKDSDR